LHDLYVSKAILILIDSDTVRILVVQQAHCIGKIESTKTENRNPNDINIGDWFEFNDSIKDFGIILIETEI